MKRGIEMNVESNKKEEFIRAELLKRFKTDDIRISKIYRHGFDKNNNFVIWIEIDEHRLLKELLMTMLNINYRSGISFHADKGEVYAFLEMN